MMKRTLLVVVLGLIAGIVIIFTLSKPETAKPVQLEKESTTAGLNTQTQNISNANPEERILLVKKARLPYENDRYAISYREDTTLEAGAVLRVIDKTPGTQINPGVRTEAIDYLKSKGVEPSSVIIEYEKSPYVQR